MMLQARDRKRSLISVSVRQKRFAPTEMSDTRTTDLLGEMPIAPCAILLQLGHAMMRGYMLQI